MVESFKQHLYEKKRISEKDVHQLFKEASKNGNQLMQRLRKIQGKVKSDAAKEDIAEYADAVQEALNTNMTEIRDLLRIIKQSQNNNVSKNKNGNSKENEKKELEKNSANKNNGKKK